MFLFHYFSCRRLRFMQHVLWKPLHNLQLEALQFLPWYSLRHFIHKRFLFLSIFLSAIDILRNNLHSYILWPSEHKEHADRFDVTYERDIALFYPCNVLLPRISAESFMSRFAFKNELRFMRKFINFSRIGNSSTADLCRFYSLRELVYFWKNIINK